MTTSRIRGVVATILTILSVAATPADAQLRPDAKAVDVAKTMKAKRASATDVTTELQKMRQNPAEVTAVLHAVGYATPDIAGVHRSSYRLDASASARTWMEAVGDQALAFRALLDLRASATEVMRAARTELRMDAKATTRGLLAARALDKDRSERAYADLTKAGFPPRDVVRALTEEVGAAPGEVFDAMLAGGASITAIAQELSDGLGQSIAQIREILAARNVDTATGAQALDAVGAEPTEVLYWVFREAVAGANQDLAYFEARGAIAKQYVASGAEAVEALSGAVSGSVLATVGFAVAAAQYGSIQAAATAGAVMAVAQAIVSSGVDISEVAVELEAFGAPGQIVGATVYAIVGSADATWTTLRDGLGWTGNQIDDALREVIPITLGYLSHLVGLGGTPARVLHIIETLRDQGTSAVAIAAEIGAQMGILPMARTLWDAGYGVADVTSGLVEGMQVGVAEATQVVAGLTGGGSDRP
jgi:hypothetical protein